MGVALIGAVLVEKLAVGTREIAGFPRKCMGPPCLFLQGKRKKHHGCMVKVGVKGVYKWNMLFALS